MAFRIVIAVFISCVCVNILAEDIHDCQAGSFYNRNSGECQLCSECVGTNQIIRFPCSAGEDTICGPFVEFDKFHQNPVDNLNPLKNITYDFEDNTQPDNKQTQFPTNIDNDKRWYTLAMALLGVLSFISLFVGIYIIVVCFVCKRRRRDKEVIVETEMNTNTPLCQTRLAEPRYIPTFRDRLRTKMPVHAYTIDEEYDADNSNQTVSSASSHYVYFKSAETEPPNC